MTEEIVHDFGNVGIGTNKTYKLVVSNPASVPLNFAVELDKHRRHHSESTCYLIKPLLITELEPTKKSYFKFKYCPQIPGKDSRYNFKILRSDGFCTNVRLIGNCVGPKVEVSNNTITFNCSSKDQVEQKHFIMTNTGAVPATFNFDISNLSQLTVEPVYGCIQPMAKLRVIVTFQCRTKIVPQYFKLLMCLILFSDPVKVSIINLSDKDKDTVISPSTVHLSLVNGSLSDDKIPNNTISNQTMNFGNPLSLSESVVNFQHCPYNDSSIIHITIMNNSELETTITWDKEENVPFESVKKIYLKPRSSQELRIKFSPAKRDQMYFSTLTGSILLKNQLLLSNMNLYLIGHSFDNESCFWPALYTIEPEAINSSQNCSVLLLPPPLPHCKRRATFLIRRHGHLPISFNFQPPPNNNFTVFPMQGLIQGPYQIVVVEVEIEEILQTMLKQEKWFIEFNFGSIKHELTLQVHINKPILIVNNNTAVRFPITHPHCFEPYFVSVMNPIHNFLRFTMQVILGGDVMHLNNVQYEVKCNETIFVGWTFNPRVPGTYSGEVLFSYSLPEFARFNFTIKVYGECKIAYLKTIPEFFSMGHIVLGSYENKMFKVINDSESSVHLTLNCRPCTLMSLMGKVHLEPDKFTINPGEVVSVEVNATPGGLYHHDLQISYTFRTREESDEYVNDTDWIPLIRFDLIGVYPIFQVVDIQLMTLKYLTKYNVWKLLDINSLNDLLKKLKFESEEQSTEIFLPSATESSTFKVLLLLKNKSLVTAEWNIVQEKTCNCRPQQQQVGLNKFKMVSVCQHRQQITLDPKIGQLEGQCYMILTLNISYKLVGEERQIFTLKINPDRMPWLSTQIKLTFVRYAIPLGVPMLSPFLPHKYDSIETYYKLMPVFIGQQKSFLQSFWMYNSTNLPVEYQLKLQCNQNQAFSCINPEGIVKPSSSHHLLFTFLPNELNMYKACFCLVVNEKELYIHVESESICSFPEMLIYQLYNKMPTYSLFLNTSRVQLTCDHILFPLIPLHTTSERIFYLNNFTEHYVIARWQSVKIKGVIYIRVIPDQFQVGPYQCIVLIVKCKTLGQPCILSSDLICHVKIMKTISTNSNNTINNQCRNEKDIIEKQIVGLTITVHANTTKHLLLKNCQKYRSGLEVLQKKKANVTQKMRSLDRERADMIIKIFDKVLWTISSSPYLEHSMRHHSPIYYKEFFYTKEEILSNKGISQGWDNTTVKDDKSSINNSDFNKSGLVEKQDVQQLDEKEDDEEINYSNENNYLKCNFENVRCPLDVKEQIFSIIINELLSDCYKNKLFEPLCN